jgi:hypothetical protein
MPLIDLDDSALVVIDVQSNFCPPQRLDADRLRYHDMVQRIAWITSVASRLAVPVVVTEEDPERNGHTEDDIRKALPPSAVGRRRPSGSSPRASRCGRSSAHCVAWPSTRPTSRPSRPSASTTPGLAFSAASGASRTAGGPLRDPIRVVITKHGAGCVRSRSYQETPARPPRCDW